jgi:SAM-dependent methyltransferase
LTALGGGKILEFRRPDGHDGEPSDGGEEATRKRIIARLRIGICPPDAVFDRLLPDEARALSAYYWTPLEVALRAASWFDEFGIRTIVDIGSGVGKFCVAAALASRCYYTGLEQRPRLVQVARDLAARLGCSDRVKFIEGDLRSVGVPAADAYYLFNPFGENLFARDERIDDDVELGDERLASDLAALREQLLRAPLGTYVVTYNGFGGRVPSAYRELRVDREFSCVLRICRKEERVPTRGSLLW